MQRIEEYNQLLEDSKEVLRKDTTLWKGFLKFATQFTHYQFFDQILIYVQNPKATACATFDQWKKIGRYVRKGEHSIVLLDETGKRGKLRHIFDVTATGPDQEFEYRPKPILPEQREELARKLNAAYSRENSAYGADSARWDGDLEHTLSQIALSMTQEYYNLSPDQAAAQSESTEIPAYYIATATSAMYLLLEKYGFSQEAESLDFSCMNQLDMEMVLVYKCRQKKLNSLYYKKKEQRRCSTWRKIKNRILRNSSNRSSISTMPEVPHILNWNMNMA